MLGRVLSKTFQHEIREPENHRKRVVDLMGHTRSQNPDGCQFFGIVDTLVHLHPFGHVPADAQHEVHLAFVVPDRDELGGQTDLSALGIDGVLVSDTLVPLQHLVDLFTHEGGVT